MNAQEAITKINSANGSFANFSTSELHEIFGALQGNFLYSDMFSKLEAHIKTPDVQTKIGEDSALMKVINAEFKSKIKYVESLDGYLYLQDMENLFAPSRENKDALNVKISEILRDFQAFEVPVEMADVDTLRKLAANVPDSLLSSLVNPFDKKAFLDFVDKKEEELEIRNGLQNLNMQSATFLEANETAFEEMHTKFRDVEANGASSTHYANLNVSDSILDKTSKLISALSVDNDVDSALAVIEGDRLPSEKFRKEIEAAANEAARLACCLDIDFANKTIAEQSKFYADAKLEATKDLVRQLIVNKLSYDLTANASSGKVLSAEDRRKITSDSDGILKAFMDGDAKKLRVNKAVALSTLEASIRNNEAVGKVIAKKTGVKSFYEKAKARREKFCTDYPRFSKIAQSVAVAGVIVGIRYINPVAGAIAASAYAAHKTRTAYHDLKAKYQNDAAYTNKSFRKYMMDHKVESLAVAGTAFLAGVSAFTGVSKFFDIDYSAASTGILRASVSLATGGASGVKQLVNAKSSKERKKALAMMGVVTLASAAAIFMSTDDGKEFAKNAMEKMGDTFGGVKGWFSGIFGGSKAEDLALREVVVPQLEVDANGNAIIPAKFNLFDLKGNQVDSLGNRVDSISNNLTLNKNSNAVLDSLDLKVNQGDSLVNGVDSISNNLTLNKNSNAVLDSLDLKVNQGDSLVNGVDSISNNLTLNKNSNAVLDSLDLKVNQGDSLVNGVDSISNNLTLNKNSNAVLDSLDLKVNQGDSLVNGVDSISNNPTFDKNGNGVPDSLERPGYEEERLAAEKLEAERAVAVDPALSPEEYSKNQSRAISNGIANTTGGKAAFDNLVGNLNKNNSDLLAAAKLIGVSPEEIVALGNLEELQFNKNTYLNSYSMSFERADGSTYVVSKSTMMNIAKGNCDDLTVEEQLKVIQHAKSHHDVSQGFKFVGVPKDPKDAWIGINRKGTVEAMPCGENNKVTSRVVGGGKGTGVNTDDIIPKGGVPISLDEVVEQNSVIADTIINKSTTNIYLEGEEKPAETPVLDEKKDTPAAVVSEATYDELNSQGSVQYALGAAEKGFIPNGEGGFKNVGSEEALKYFNQELPANYANYGKEMIETGWAKPVPSGLDVENSSKIGKLYGESFAGKGDSSPDVFMVKEVGTNGEPVIRPYMTKGGEFEQALAKSDPDKYGASYEASLKEISDHEGGVGTERDGTVIVDTNANQTATVTVSTNAGNTTPVTSDTGANQGASVTGNTANAAQAGNTTPVTGNTANAAQAGNTTPVTGSNTKLGQTSRGSIIVSTGGRN